MRRKTHILVIDAEGISRDGLCALLQVGPDLHVDGAFDSARSAVRSRGDLKPAVVLIDLPIAMQTGPESITHLKRRWPHTRVLVLSGRSEGRVIEAARRAGADGFVMRNDGREQLFEAIHELAGGRHYISKSVLEPRARTDRTDRHPAPHAARGTNGVAMLTDREQEVVTLIAEGYRTREMAQLLSLSHKTVERHRTNLMRKLGVRSATDVVAYALTHGYVGF
jgi:DNA-binding NarL/FixJ family response regulator